MFTQLTAAAIRLFARFITAVRAIWKGIEPTVERQRIYFANHASHGDFILVWTTLPPALRRRVRPVAGADYWLTSPLKRFLIRDVFNAVLIDRDAASRDHDPIAVMREALAEGSSLILFPEGTRNVSGGKALLPFRSGLYHLALACPEVELVPVWIANLNRVMPKGEIVPIPLMCSVTYGEPLAPAPGEEKAAFLSRAANALAALDPDLDQKAPDQKESARGRDGS